MTVYDLIHKTLTEEAQRTEPDGREMIRQILLQAAQKQNAPPQQPEDTQQNTDE